MLRRVFSDLFTKEVGSYGRSKVKLGMYMLTSTVHSGQPHSAPRSFFGVEDYMDDNNSRPYTYKKEKKSKNPQKHISFKQRTIAFMEPFTLDVFISKRFVQASITHRVTCKQVAVAGTNSKDVKAALQSRCDIPACLAIGRFLADRAREADVYTASYTPRDRDKFEGKIRAVVQSLIDNGIDVKDLKLRVFKDEANLKNRKKMGSCFSDLKGGQEAQGGQTIAPAGINDAVDFFYTTRGFQPLYTQLELSLSAKNLRNMDFISKSDPMAVIYLKKRDGTLDEIGRTEVILNNLSPSWIKKLSIAYQFEIVQSLVFHVYDIDTKFHNVPVKSLNLSQQDFLGEANCVLSEIVTKQNCSLTMKLGNKDGHGQHKHLGTLTVHAEDAISLRTAVEIVFNCKHLDNKDLLSKSDPFLRISRIIEDGQPLPICKTEVVKNNLNPRWNPDNPLIIECFDFDSSGNHELIGKLQKSVVNLENMYRDKTGANFIKLHRNHEKVLKGQLFVESFVKKQQFSFLDYISSGFEINFMVAVDFTVIIDDFSHYIWCFPLKYKSDTAAYLKQFHAYVQTQFPLKLKSIQCDHGREFDNNDLQSFFSNHGVLLRFSCPHTSQQNGKAERMIRTITNTIRTLLFHGHLPPRFWVEALNTATYLLNITPTTTLAMRTPHQLLFNQLPSYGHLRVFGCLCYPNLTATTKHKLEPRTRPCVFLGYALQHRGYRCLDLANHKVIISRHVIFDESVFPFTNADLGAFPTLPNVAFNLQAIMNVGEVIQFYDSDKCFPTWGFGGRVNGSISHCFNLNGNPHVPEVTGVEGIMAAYSSALRNVTLAGPTLFSCVIDKAAEFAAQSLAHESSKYYVLLIINDGVLTDLQETKDALVRASNLPLSILIIGVGNADFSQMEILDADTGPRLASSTGQLASRDIVQFVPMRDEISVVQRLLEELPEQFLAFMRSRNIKPKNVILGID
ncbi:hypothetical protein V2J09_007902 [Rumex salicifolius]